MSPEKVVGISHDSLDFSPLDQPVAILPLGYHTYNKHHGILISQVQRDLKYFSQSIVPLSLTSAVLKHLLYYQGIQCESPPSTCLHQ
jgi:hypothetical protein